MDVDIGLDPGAGAGLLSTTLHYILSAAPVAAAVCSYEWCWWVGVCVFSLALSKHVSMTTNSNLQCSKLHDNNQVDF